MIHDTVTNKEVYMLVDEMPMYIGKELSMKHFIIVRCKDSPIKVGLQFTVILRFVIDKDGNLIGACIYGKREDEYTEEEKLIIQTLESSPQWRPGLCSGEKVNVLIHLKLGFSVDENGRLR